MIKQLIILTAIDTFSCLSGPGVKHHTAVQEVPGSIPDSSSDVKHYIIYEKNVIPFAIVYTTCCKLL